MSIVLGRKKWARGRTVDRAVLLFVGVGLMLIDDVYLENGRTHSLCWLVSKVVAT
jgi:hypothetical protein